MKAQPAIHRTVRLAAGALRTPAHVLALAAGVALGIAACAGTSTATREPTTAGDAPAPAPETLLTPGAHTITVHGHALAFHVAGHGPLCLAHPGGPGLEWSYLRMPEVEQVLTLIYLEPVGTGASGRLRGPQDYSYAHYAEDLDLLRRALGQERICLLGHSHGGLVALTYATTYGDHLSGLIAYGTTPAIDDAWSRDLGSNMASWFVGRAWLADARAGVSAFYEARTDDDATSAFHRWMPAFFADWDATPAAVRDAMLAGRVWAGPARYRGHYDVVAALARFHAPTLVVTGRRDYAMSPVTAERIHAAIAGSSLVVIDDAGHMAHLEQPHAFAEAVRAFVPALR